MYFDKSSFLPKLRRIESQLVEHPFPPQVVIETTSHCNMKCLHCAHPSMQRENAHMKEAVFKKIVEEIADAQRADLGLD